VIRVGESVWSTWEPEDGVLDLDWLEPVLDEAHERGIGVILGTPTYAIPMWLKRRYPEIAGESATGQPIGWGARQEVDFTHAAYLFHAERIIRAVVTRYREHPAIIGYQVDNEPGLRLAPQRGHLPAVRRLAAAPLRTVESLNEEWGLVYWSHRLSTWADLWRPDGNYQPQYDLAWRRFQTELVTDFIGWQADIVRELVDPSQVRDDLHLLRAARHRGRRPVRAARRRLWQRLLRDGVLARASQRARHVGRPDGLGRPRAVGVSHLADLMYSSRQAPFLVTETNAGSIGFSSLNQSPYDGQWRQAAWLLVARGARMISYWHWNTLRFGAETYWGGVLPHSGEPGRVYRELAVLGGELGRAGDAFADAEPDFDVAVLYDSDSKLAWPTQAPFSAPGQFFDPDSYRRIVGAFTRGVFDAQRQQRLVRPRQLLRHGAASCRPTRLRLATPCSWSPPSTRSATTSSTSCSPTPRAGGHLVLGPRSGYADREGRPREERQPAGLSTAAGVGYDELATLSDPVPVSGEPLTGAATLVAGAPRARWCRGARRLRPPAPRLLGSGDDARGRLGPDHGRGHGPRPGAGRRPGALAGPRSARRLAAPGLRHGGDLDHLRRSPPARAAPLGLGTADGLRTCRAPRPPHRRGGRPRHDAAARCLGRPHLPATPSERNVISMTDPTPDAAARRALEQLTLEEKVQLLTGRDFWNTWPLEKIGLRRILVSDGPSGVRGETWDERDPRSTCRRRRRWRPPGTPTSPAATAPRPRSRPSQGRRRGARPHHQPAPLPAQRPALRVLQRGPGAHGRPGGGVRARRPGQRRRATPKHYIANDSETDRFTVDVQVDERPARELYLLAFEKAITEARAWLVMSSYNSVNGATATENDLLETPLNSEWGFDGVVVSDWTAVRSLDSARASQDLVMPGPDGPWGAALVKAVEAGDIDVSVVDRKVLRILRLAERVGALEGTPGPSRARRGRSGVRRGGRRRGMVLLTNDGSLPLDATDLQRVAVIGDNAPTPAPRVAAARPCCRPTRCRRSQGLRAALPRADVTYSVGAVSQTGLPTFRSTS
jgi:beta-galactosidase